MKIGIEKIDAYAGRLCVAVEDIVQKRGAELKYVRDQLMCHERSIFPPYEDSVTQAVNAAKRLITPEDAERVELVVVGSESAVDYGKPIATWVHRYCGIQPNCRVVEVKHACYSGTGALKLAASWVASSGRPGAKALVVTTDTSRNFIGEPWEYIGGGGAVAMLVSDDPQILDIELGRAGYWTNEISDAFRPTVTQEVMNDEMSVYSYLEALDGAFSHYERVCGQVDFARDFKKHIYHAPFPGMTKTAHRSLLKRVGVTKKAAMELDFQQKVEESLRFAKRIGSAYGSSNFVCLLGLLASAADLAPSDRISLYSYGSGCQGEFYGARIGPAAKERVRSLNMDGRLDERARISVDEYETNERSREVTAVARDGRPLQEGRGALYDRQYAGRGLLVLEQIDNYHRTYTWS